MNGADLIKEERLRQVSEEGWVAEHDDELGSCTLAVAGACYALGVAGGYSSYHEIWLSIYTKQALELWPFDAEWWKPTEDPIRQLTKAGALIAAEIDRFQRNTS